jgi:hypothetical protein
MSRAWLVHCKATESRLDVARRLVCEEIDNLADSAPRSILRRLEQIAKDIERIECSL